MLSGGIGGGVSSTERKRSRVVTTTTTVTMRISWRRHRRSICGFLLRRGRCGGIRRRGTERCVGASRGDFSEGSSPTTPTTATTSRRESSATTAVTTKESDARCAVFRRSSPAARYHREPWCRYDVPARRTQLSKHRPPVRALPPHPGASPCFAPPRRVCALANADLTADTSAFLFFSTPTAVLDSNSRLVFFGKPFHPGGGWGERVGGE